MAGVFLVVGFRQVTYWKRKATMIIFAKLCTKYQIMNTLQTVYAREMKRDWMKQDSSDKAE